MNKVLLIYPPYERLRGALGRDYPIGLGHLATMLRREGVEAWVYNADFSRQDLAHTYGDILQKTESQDFFINNFHDDQHPAWQDCWQCFRDQMPQMVGLYTTTVSYPVALKLLRGFKRISPEVITVLGGPHVTLLPGEVMAHPEVDYLLMGEADFTLPQLCRELDRTQPDLSGINGLGYRQGEQVIINREYKYIDDLAALPLVQREYTLFEEEYPGDLLGGQVMGSRGCPYNCTFCASASIWGHHVRFRSAQGILDELVYLKRRYHIKDFLFWDDTFTVNRKLVQEFCSLLKKANLGLNWACSTRADIISPDMLRALKEAGCKDITLGVESGSDQVLRAMKKKITVDQILRATALIKNFGMKLITCFVVGLPYESGEDIRKTIQIMKKIRPDATNFSTFFPYPGTEAYEETLRQGLIAPDFDWARNLSLGHHSFYNKFTAKISDQEYRDLIQEGLETAKYFNGPRLGKTLRKHWSYRDQYLADPWGTLGKVVRRLRG